MGNSITGKMVAMTVGVKARGAAAAARGGGGGLRQLSISLFVRRETPV